MKPLQIFEDLFCQGHVATAHVYVLAVLVALCSGVWPYTKSYCWGFVGSLLQFRKNWPNVIRSEIDVGEVGARRHLRDDADVGRVPF